MPLDGRPDAGVRGPGVSCRLLRSELRKFVAARNGFRIDLADAHSFVGSFQSDAAGVVRERELDHPSVPSRVAPEEYGWSDLRGKDRAIDRIIDRDCRQWMTFRRRRLRPETRGDDNRTDRNKPGYSDLDNRRPQHSPAPLVLSLSRKRSADRLGTATIPHRKGHPLFN